MSFTALVVMHPFLYYAVYCYKTLLIAWDLFQDPKTLVE